MQRWRLGFCFLFILMFAAKAWGADLTQQAQQKVAQKVAQTMPRDVHIRSLAITSIKGDDGTLTRLLTQMIEQDSHFILVERQQLDEIVQEQGLQVSDMISRDNRVEPGQIKGVEGILFGEVVEDNGWPLQAKLRVHLRLANVQTGEILMAKDFSAASASPYRNTVYAAVALGIFLLAAGIMLRAVRRSRAQRSEKTSWDVRQKSTQELQTTQKNLNRAEASLHNLLSHDSLEQIRNMSFQVGRIKDKLQTVKWGRDGSGSSRQLRREDQRFQAEARSLRELSDRMQALAQSGDDKKMQNLLLEIKDKTDSLRSVIEGR
ncbi:MAG: CsgG/HfaB family protein [Desulfohalobiaceae bacterium]